MITSAGLAKIAKILVEGTTLDLLNGNAVISGNNYASLTCMVGQPSAQDMGTKAGFTVDTSASGTAVLKNYKFYFNDADNGTSTTTGSPASLWHVTGLRFSSNAGVLYTGEFASAIDVGQFMRPKFDNNAIQITFTSTENNS